MFFLLLFFLIVSTLANPNVIKVLLPSANASQSMNKQQITLTVTADKKYFINQEEIQFSKLEEVLRTRISGISNPTIVLRFNKTLNIQDLVDVLELGVKMNLKMVMAIYKG